MKIWQKHLKERYSALVNQRFSDVPAISELYLPGAMFFVIADDEGREKAYEFVKGILQKMEPTSHESIYCLKDLKKVKGDIFTNFCKCYGLQR